MPEDNTSESKSSLRTIKIPPLDTGTNFFVGPPSPVTNLPPVEPPVEQTRDRKPLRTWEERNRTVGVPMDTRTGISALNRARLGVRLAREDQRRFLESQYPGNVFEADDGRWIVRQPGPGGRQIDVAVDPIGVDAGDFAELFVTALPDMLSAAASVFLAKKIPRVGALKGIKGATRDILASAVGPAVTGAATEATIKGAEGVLDMGAVPEIFKRQATKASIDVALGGTIGSALGGLKFLRNPLAGNRTHVQLDMVASRKALKDKYGINIDLAASEVSGHPTFARLEEFVEKQPGAAEVYQRLYDRRTENLNLLRRRMAGDTLHDIDAIGLEVMDTLQSVTKANDMSVIAARRKVAETATREILKEAESAAPGAPKGVWLSKGGENIRTKLTALKDAAEKEADDKYKAFYALGGDQPIFGGGGLSAGAKAIREDMLRAQGPNQAAKRAIQVAYVPGDIRKMVDALVASDKLSFRHSDLVAMRRRVNDLMDRSMSVKDIDTHTLGKLSDLISTEIENGLNAIGNPALKAAGLDAAKTYKEKVVPFRLKGINEAIVPEIDGGIGPHQLASSYIKGAGATDRWNTLVKFLGPDSDEIKLMKRQVMDLVIDESTEPGGQFINAKRFLSGLDSFRVNNRELFDKTFGPNGWRMIREAKALQSLDEFDKIPASELDVIIRSGQTGRSLGAAIRAERKASYLYKNQIMRDVRGNSLDEAKLDPYELVNKFIGHATPAEITEVIGYLEKAGKTETIKNLRQAGMERILSDRVETGQLSKALGLSLGVREVNPTGQRWQAFLGPEMFDDLRNMARIDLGTSRRIDSGSAMAGGLAAGEKIGSIEKFQSPTKLWLPAVFNRALAHVLTSSSVRKIAATDPQFETKIFPWVVATMPSLLENTLNEFGDDSEGVSRALAFVDQVKRGVDSQISSTLNRRGRSDEPEEQPQRRVFKIPPPAPITNQ